MSYGQFESVHPLHGSVLIQNDTLYCMAGRSMFLDGGIRFYRLNPATGEVISLSVLDEIDPTTGENLQNKVTEQTLPPALPDILSSDGRFIYLRSQKFDFEGNRHDVAAYSKKAADLVAMQKGATAHLFARAGFLEDSRFHRLFWTYGKVDFGGHQGDPYVPPFTPTGDILAFNDTDVFGYASDFKGARIKHALFSIPKDFQTIRHRQSTGEREKRREGNKKKGRGKRSKRADAAETSATTTRLKYNWIRNCPLRIDAMAIAGDVLFAAGSPQDFPSRATGTTTPKLLSYAIEDGRLLSELPLPAPPKFDGMAVANSRLYLTLKDGSVLCFDSAKSRQ